MNFLTSKNTDALAEQSSACSFLSKQHRATLSFAAIMIAVTFGFSGCESPVDHRYGRSYDGGGGRYSDGSYQSSGYGGYGLGYGGYGGGIIIGGTRHGGGFGGHHIIGQSFGHGGFGGGYGGHGGGFSGGHSGFGGGGGHGGGGHGR